MFAVLLIDVHSKVWLTVISFRCNYLPCSAWTPRTDSLVNEHSTKIMISKVSLLATHLNVRLLVVQQIFGPTLVKKLHVLMIHRKWHYSSIHSASQQTMEVAANKSFKRLLFQILWKNVGVILYHFIWKEIML